MTKNTLIKVLGLAATVIGAGMSLVTDWVNEQKMEEKIEEKVNEALAKTDEEESYYDNMVTEAVKTISQYGDFEWFVSDDPYVPDTPPWQEPSEPWNDRTPYDVR